MNRRIPLVLVLAGLALVAACSRPSTDAGKLAAVEAMYEGYKKDFPAVPDIAGAAARQLYAQGGTVFVDARPDNERAVSVLPGAVAEAEFLSDPGRYAGKAVIAYCTIGYRSGKLAERLAAQGIPVMNLRGGILAWVLSGGAVYGPDGRPVKAIHVYGAKWDYPPAGYVSVY
jgi:sodium/bile acid cotransporter 7